MATYSPIKKEEVYLKCDVCGATIHFEIDVRDRPYILDVAANFGWVKYNGKIVCNSCKEEY